MRHVFPQSNERMNWSNQFRARTHHLKGGTKDKGTKWCHKRPKCHRCGQKTKVWHVLKMCYECKQCVNVQMKVNRLITHNDAKRTYNVTDSKLASLCCIRFQPADHNKICRHYLEQSVVALSRKSSVPSTNTTYQQAILVGPSKHRKHNTLVRTPHSFMHS